MDTLLVLHAAGRVTALACTRVSPPNAAPRPHTHVLPGSAQTSPSKARSTPPPGGRAALCVPATHTVTLLIVSVSSCPLASPASLWSLRPDCVFSPLSPGGTVTEFNVTEPEQIEENGIRLKALVQGFSPKWLRVMRGPGESGSVLLGGQNRGDAPA